jgi:hypothetical protein
MRRGSRTDLRLAVECLPRHTRVAMLEGVRGNDIIVGAYTDRHGGVCPMLAAHRCGGRTDFLAFAKAWDRFARARRPRRATEREVAVLVGMLEATLAAEADLGHAIADHQRAARERRAREARRTGWAWVADAELGGLSDRLPDLEAGLLEHDLRDGAAR